MRAAVLTEINKPLQILDLEQEPPHAGEVRVQVKAAGVCMSEWHIMNGAWPMPLVRLREALFPVPLVEVRRADFFADFLACFLAAMSHYSFTMWANNVPSRAD